MLSDKIAAERGLDLATTLVKRNDFKQKFALLTGELDPLSEAVKRVSFQEHFVDLSKKTLKIIQRPIDTDEMRPFHMNKMSKVKDLLNLNQLSYTAPAPEAKPRVPRLLIPDSPILEVECSESVSVSMSDLADSQSELSTEYR